MRRKKKKKEEEVVKEEKKKKKSIRILIDHNFFSHTTNCLFNQFDVCSMFNVRVWLLRRFDNRTASSWMYALYVYVCIFSCIARLMASFEVELFGCFYLFYGVLFYIRSKEEKKNNIKAISFRWAGRGRRHSSPFAV